MKYPQAIDAIFSKQINNGYDGASAGCGHFEAFHERIFNAVEHVRTEISRMEDLGRQPDLLRFGRNQEYTLSDVAGGIQKICAMANAYASNFELDENNSQLIIEMQKMHLYLQAILVLPRVEEAKKLIPLDPKTQIPVYDGKEIKFGVTGIVQEGKRFVPA